MSIDIAKSAIRDFLSVNEYQVLAINGDWGVGKTYAWKSIVEDTSTSKWPSHYAYVSLFGVSSLSELRVAIIGSRLMPGSGGADGASGLKALTDNLPSWFKLIGNGIDVVAPTLVKDMLICIDDFERLNTTKLSHDQVLGFISNLKETVRCKIVLIMNEEKLAGEDHPYKKYREKVIDQEVRFVPTSEEATEWGLPSSLPYRDGFIEASFYGSCRIGNRGHWAVTRSRLASARF